MTALTRLAALALAAVLLVGCNGTPTEPTPPSSDAPIDPGQGQPEFRGRLDVILQPGQIEQGRDGCAAQSDQLRACDRLRELTLRLLGDPVPGHLASVTTELVGGGTSWQVTFRVEPEERRQLRQVREAARSTGAAVVMIGPSRRVLVSAAVPDVNGRSITLTGLPKAEAWDLVQQVEDLG